MIFKTVSTKKWNIVGFRFTVHRDTKVKNKQIKKTTSFDNGVFTLLLDVCIQSILKVVLPTLIWLFSNTALLKWHSHYLTFSVSDLMVTFYIEFCKIKKCLYLTQIRKIYLHDSQKKRKYLKKYFDNCF